MDENEAGNRGSASGERQGQARRGIGYDFTDRQPSSRCLLRFVRLELPKTMPKITINLEDACWAIGIIALLILFSGTPDLMDAVIYKLTEGKVELPKP